VKARAEVDRLLVMAGDTKRAWDQRLTEHWASQAREAANDPRMCNRPSFREQVSSPLYWVGTAALGIGSLTALLGASNSSAGTIGVAVGYVVGLVALGIDQRRWRRRQAPRHAPPR
jgi:hypothetical protein